MAKPLSEKSIDVLRRLTRRNVSESNGKGTVLNMFGRVAAVRKLPEGHAKVLAEIAQNADVSASVAIAKSQESQRPKMFDLASMKVGGLVPN